MKIPTCSGSASYMLPCIKTPSVSLFMPQEYYLNLFPKFWPYLRLAVLLSINWQGKKSTNENSQMLWECLWLDCMHQNTFSFIIYAPVILFKFAPKLLTVPLTSSPSQYKLTREKSTIEDSHMHWECLWLDSMHQNIFSIIIYNQRLLFKLFLKNWTLP